MSELLSFFQKRFSFIYANRIMEVSTWRKNILKTMGETKRKLTPPLHQIKVQLRKEHTRIHCFGLFFGIERSYCNFIMPSAGQIMKTLTF